MRPGVTAMAARTTEDLAPVAHLHVWEPDEESFVESEEMRTDILQLFNETEFDADQTENDVEQVRTANRLFRGYRLEPGETEGLDPDTERSLILQAKAGDREARAHLIMSNLRLVTHIARYKMGRGVELQDLIQEGSVGLIQGIDAFETENENRLAAFVTWRIRNGMIHLIANQSRAVRVPAHVRTDLNKWNNAERELFMQTGEKPDAAKTEATADVQLEISTLRKARDIVEQPTLQATYKTKRHGEDAHTIELPDRSAERPEKAVEKADEIRFLLSRLGKLFDRHEKVIRLRYGLDDGLPRTLDQTAAILKVSRETVRLDEIEAIERLKELAGVMPIDSLSSS